MLTCPACGAASLSRAVVLKGLFRAPFHCPECDALVQSGLPRWSALIALAVPTCQLLFMHAFPGAGSWVSGVVLLLLTGLALALGIWLLEFDRQLTRPLPRSAARRTAGGPDQPSWMR